MTTLPTPYAPSYTTSRADDDTLHMPLPTVDRTDRALDRRPAAQVLDATRLWTGSWPPPPSPRWSRWSAPC